MSLVFSDRCLHSEDICELRGICEVRCRWLKDNAAASGGLGLLLYERGVMYGDRLFRFKDESIGGS